MLLEHGFAILMLVQVINGAPPIIETESRGFYSYEDCVSATKMFNSPESLAAMDTFTRTGGEILFQQFTCHKVIDIDFNDYEEMMEKSRQAKANG